MVYFNLARADQLRTAQRLLERYFAPFGDSVTKRALNSVHMFNYRDEECMRTWRLANELDISDIVEAAPN